MKTKIRSFKARLHKFDQERLDHPTSSLTSGDLIKSALN